MSRPSYNPDCEACSHERICALWSANECQDAACYVNDCFEAKFRPCSDGAPAEREDAKTAVEIQEEGKIRPLFANPLIAELERISAMEPPETWVWPNPIPISYEVLLIIKTACGAAASEMRKVNRNEVMRMRAYEPPVEIKGPDALAYNKALEGRLDDFLREMEADT